MKYTITNVDTKTISVTYEDGTVLFIPTVTGANKEYYARQIKTYQPQTIVEVPVKDVPYKKGDTGTVGDDIPAESTPTEPKYDYLYARAYCYPTDHAYLEAFYPFATNGDATKKAAYDAHIKLVWDNIPADSTQYTQAEIDAKLVELKKDSAFIQ